MRSYNGTIKQLARLGLLLMMGASMSGCSQTMEWEEEVLLHDGQIIIAKRQYNLGGYPALESQERAVIDVTATFSLPNSHKTIIWHTNYSNSRPEPNSLNMIRFDVIQGVPYIATYPAGCIAYNKWGRPNPPQVLFKHTNDQWQRISQAEYPAELINTQANVVVGRPATKLLKSFYTVKGVNAENREIDTAEYRSILREPYSGAGRGCAPMAHYKCGWFGINPDGTFNKEFADRMCNKQ